MGSEEDKYLGTLLILILREKKREQERKAEAKKFASKRRGGRGPRIERSLSKTRRRLQEGFEARERNIKKYEKQEE